MMRPFIAQISRDLDIAWQNRQDVVVMLGFFIIIIALFPLAIGPQSAMLQSLSIPIIWIAALLSSLTGFDRLFAQDVRDGWLDQISLSALGLGWYAVAKAVAHWLTASLPLLMITPILALMLNIAPARLPALMVALLVGSMGLTLLGVIGAALAEGARRSSALIAILVLPLAVPVLIFGALAAAADDGIINPHLMLLGAMLALLLAMAPLVAAIALKIGETESGI
jgi:heme exporter protein B